MSNLMIHIKKNSMPLSLRNEPVVLYGGGACGKLILEFLLQEGINVAYIVDDSVHLQGTYLSQVSIISKEEFCEYCKGYEKIAVIMSTIYGKAALNKISLMPNIQVYELYDWYLELNDYKNRVQKMFIDVANVQKMKDEINLLRNSWADKESRDVLDGIVNYIDTGDLNVISEICTADEHYFIPEVIEAIKFPLIIIDGGACKGELRDTLLNSALDYEKYYFFETDSGNYNFLVELIQKEAKSQQHICINKGLWSESKKLYFAEGADHATGKIVDYETDQSIETVSIDEYFDNKKCNYIKMDIEGAEYEALVGGIQVIKRDRPILAISIYHSLEDFWRIPKYLMSELSDYRFYVRQHALIFSETVLYGIPEEL